MIGASAEASQGIRDYITVIDELEKIDELLAPPKYKRCCYGFLEFLKSLLMLFKIKSK